MPQDMKRMGLPADGGEPFWKRKPLSEMSSQEWESLCDGCGRCCLIKLEDIDSGELAHTDVACRLLDCQTCRCTSYANRHELVADCVTFTAASIAELEWMPPTCAYRLVAAGRDLYWWHPLVSGDPDLVHEAGISVRGRAVSESGVAFDKLEDHVVEWPGEEPTDSPDT
jgi:hypothetical protein